MSVYYTPLALDMLTYNGTTPQSVWPWLGLYPGQDLAYQGTAFVCAASYDLGSAAAIGNHNFEIVGPLAGTGVNGIDADPALVIYDFLTNAQYGAGFDAASHQRDEPVRLGRRRIPADLLPGDGAGLLAGSERPGAGLEHPDAMAATALLRGRVERRAAQVRALRRFGDRQRRGNDADAAILDPEPGPGFERLSDPGRRHRRGRRELRRRRRRGLRFDGRSARLRRRRRSRPSPELTP